MFWKEKLVAVDLKEYILQMISIRIRFLITWIIYDSLSTIIVRIIVEVEEIEDLDLGVLDLQIQELVELE